MSAPTTSGQRMRFKAGRILLLSAAALMTLNHSVLSLVLDELILFIGYAAFNLYALLVIAIPLGRREKWAWYTTWVLPIGLAIPGSMDPAIAPMYYVVAALCVAGLLLSMGEVFAGRRDMGRDTSGMRSVSDS